MSKRGVLTLVTGTVVTHEIALAIACILFIGEISRLKKEWAR